MFRFAHKLTDFIGVCSFVAFPFAAHAQVTLFTDRAAFLAATTNLVTLDFSSLINYNYSTPNGVTLNGVQFVGTQTATGSNFLYVAGPNTYPYYAGWNDNPIILQGPPGQDNGQYSAGYLDIKLPANTTVVGMNLYTVLDEGRPITFSLSTGQTFTVGTFTKPTLAFAGFTSRTPITSIRVTTADKAFPNLSSFCLNPSPSANVSGTVTLGDCNDPEQAITFEFRPKPSGTAFKRKVLLTQSGANSGTFSLPNIPKGTYDIAVKGFCWLQRVIPNVVVNGDVSGLNATLLSADLNNDNAVDIADFGILVNEYNAQGDP